MGALVAGSEYGWGTLKTILTQRPGRSAVLAGKLLAIVTAILVVVVGVFALNALWSWVIAATEDRAADWPSALELAKGIGAGWLVLGTWSLVGAALGILFRSTSLAIGRPRLGAGGREPRAWLRQRARVPRRAAEGAAGRTPGRSWPRWERPPWMSRAARPA